MGITPMDRWHLEGWSEAHQAWEWWGSYRGRRAAIIAADTTRVPRLRVLSAEAGVVYEIRQDVGDPRWGDQYGVAALDGPPIAEMLGWRDSVGSRKPESREILLIDFFYCALPDDVPARWRSTLEYWQSLSNTEQAELVRRYCEGHAI